MQQLIIGLLYLNLFIYLFLILTYVRKIKHNPKKRYFLFGSLFMVLLMVIKDIYWLLAPELHLIFNLALVLGLESVAMSGLLLGELHALKRYLKEYK